MSRWLLGFSVFICVMTAQAKVATLYPKLILDNITQIKTSEKGGDELYWVITKFQSSHDSLQYTIPKYPVHWPSKALGQLKNIPLWSGKLRPRESSILYLELVEHDAPPFNRDDSLGAIRFVIQNKKGHLKVTWQESENVKYTHRHIHPLIFKDLIFNGAGGKYNIKMHFQEQAIDAEDSFLKD